MNAGQYQGILAELKKIVEQQDEIRRAVNRIDGRLKEQQEPERTAKIVREEMSKVMDGPS